MHLMAESAKELLATAKIARGFPKKIAKIVKAALTNRALKA